MKLIRNKIPQIAAENGDEIKVRQAEPGEMASLLSAKVKEEAGELGDAEDRAQRIDEAADLLTALDAFLGWHGIRYAEVLRRASEKSAERGDFGEGWVLEDE